MKTLLILGIAGLHGLCAGADVTVSLDGKGVVPMMTLARAQKMAGSMFSEIGVGIRWTSGKPAAARSECPAPDNVEIHIRIVDRIAGAKPGQLARAWPYAAGGPRRIWIFYDPTSFGADATLLAHIMVHEIGHVLQGVARHSETGIMKASWNGKDYFEMKNNPLTFTSGDIELIHTALGRRPVGGCSETLLATR